jgi:hypothetical protein
VEDGIRGGTEIAGPPFLTFIFENCWPVRWAGRIGLLGAVPKKTRGYTEIGIADIRFRGKQSLDTHKAVSKCIRLADHIQQKPMAKLDFCSAPKLKEEIESKFIIAPGC